jgi:hypothetical protein
LTLKTDNNVGVSPTMDKALIQEQKTKPMEPGVEVGIGTEAATNGRRGTSVSFKVSKGTYLLATEYVKSLDKDSAGTKWESLEEYLENVCYDILAKKQNTK